MQRLLLIFVSVACFFPNMGSSQPLETLSVFPDEGGDEEWMLSIDADDTVQICVQDICLRRGPDRRGCIVADVDLWDGTDDVDAGLERVFLCSLGRSEYCDGAVRPDGSEIGEDVPWDDRCLPSPAHVVLVLSAEGDLIAATVIPFSEDYDYLALVEPLTTPAIEDGPPLLWLLEEWGCGADCTHGRWVPFRLNTDGDRYHLQSVPIDQGDLGLSYQYSGVTDDEADRGLCPYEAFAQPEIDEETNQYRILARSSSTRTWQEARLVWSEAYSTLQIVHTEEAEAPIVSDGCGD